MTDTTTPDAGRVGVRIQCSDLPDGERPKPHYILPTAQVSRQDVWQGNPSSLLGFQRTLTQEHVDLTFNAWWRDPQSAVGLYPIFVYRDTGITVHQTTVERVSVNNPGDILRAPAEEQTSAERALLLEPGSCSCGGPGTVATEWVQTCGGPVSMCLRCGKARD